LRKQLATYGNRMAKEPGEILHSEADRLELSTDVPIFWSD